MFRDIIKKLFCNHEWKLIGDEFDLKKYKRVFIYVCKNCGKEKRVYYE